MSTSVATTPHVLIVGAGLGGLLLGALLEKCNIPYDILERASSVKPLGKYSTCTHPTSGTNNNTASNSFKTNISHLFIAFPYPCWVSDINRFSAEYRFADGALVLSAGYLRTV